MPDITLYHEAQGALSNNLISYWKLDEASGTRVDSFGTNNLASNNAVGSGSGIINNGAVFVAASTQYLNIASNSSLVMTGNPSFTITAWVKFSSVGADQSIVAKDFSASRDYTLDFSSGADRLRFYIQGGGTYIAVDTTPVSTGIWYFVAAWYRASDGSVHIRVNDVTTSDSVIGSGGTDTGSSEFRIGARQYVGAEGYSSATIDEVGLWKRLLTSSEITQLYNAGAGLPYSSF